MIPPSTSTNADCPRERLAALRQLLLRLHKALIDSERATYERTFGSLSSPTQFLQLLLRDPWFAWLRPLSGLLLQIDETLDGEEPVTADHTHQFLERTRALLKVSEEGDGFPRSYFEALQREPDVVLAHAELAKCLKGSS